MVLLYGTLICLKWLVVFIFINNQIYIIYIPVYARNLINQKTKLEISGLNIHWFMNPHTHFFCFWRIKRLLTKYLLSIWTLWRISLIFRICPPTSPGTKLISLSRSLSCLEHGTGSSLPVSSISWESSFSFEWDGLS